MESIMADGEDINVSVPRGGPIYVRDMVGPLTKIPNFENLVIKELEKLRSEVCVDLFDIPDEDLCVDQLKIISEDELVNKAFEEASEDVGELGNSFKASGAQPEARKDYDRISSSEQACLEGSPITQAVLVPNEALNDSLVRTNDAGELGGNVVHKKKRRGPKAKCRNQSIEKESYFKKVEQLAKIKQKQEEDKAAACLHSFKGGLGVNGKLNVLNVIETMDAHKSTISGVKVRQSNVEEYVPVIHPEIVLCVEVYHKKRPSSKIQEFLVLGCQPLSDLRDCICCSTDELMTKAGQYDPSGYFLIEEIFYNDLRDPFAIDYSEPVFGWLRESADDARKKWKSIISADIRFKQNTGSHLPRFKVAEMHNKRFRDLQFRPGANYMYCHQGDCKHVIIIRDLRLIHPEDIQKRAAYPICTFKIKPLFQKCSVCKIFRAEKVTVDDKWAMENPSYFCKNCYYMLHYEGGSLLYDEFSVYDHHQDY